MAIGILTGEGIAQESTEPTAFDRMPASRYGVGAIEGQFEFFSVNRRRNLRRPTVSQDLVNVAWNLTDNLTEDAITR